MVEGIFWKFRQNSSRPSGLRAADAQFGSRLDRTWGTLLAAFRLKRRPARETELLPHQNKLL